ncbi:MFS transporter [Candidatus Gracilibacteria bacterium]|nr:MFS transporter [Candidatus Gracilibacteria bacterium]
MAGVVFLPSYWMVLVAVVLSGIGSAAFHPEALTQTRRVSGDRTATGASIFFFGGNMGFALGPLVVALLIQYLGTPGAALMIVPTLIGVTALLSQRRLFANANANRNRNKSVIAAIGTRQARLTLIGLLLLLIVMRSTVLTGLQAFIPLYFMEVEGMSKAAVAQMLTILALCGAVGTLFSGPLAERIGRRNVMVAAMAVVLVALAVFLRSDGLVRLLALAVAGAAITAPWTLTVVMVQDAMPNRLGLAGGLTLGTAYGASGLGVAALGLYADYAGLAATLQLLTLLPVLVLVLSLFVPNRAPKA